MGLTRTSHRAERGSRIPADAPEILLAGNPNVGKSTVFNALCGMHQHTGNWSGKTVGCAEGRLTVGDTVCRVVDLPGCTSLLARSPEEEEARRRILASPTALTVVVCDASCLTRSMNLTLQLREICPRLLVCINLLDEASRHGIRVDPQMLENRLGVPVIGICARRRADIDRLAKAALAALKAPENESVTLPYPSPLTDAALPLCTALTEEGIPARRAEFLSLRLLEGSETPDSLSPGCHAKIEPILAQCRAAGITEDYVTAEIAQTLMQESARITADVARGSSTRPRRDPDRILTGRLFAFPVMLALLLVIFWLTIVGANYPSAWLSSLFTALEAPMHRALLALHLPHPIADMLVYGMYRVLAWVTSVMLPPMAIFFPLFTLLEDIGYLPRIAYNLDRCFAGCRSCGKQALTMCMGFGCNAAGVVGCRIIDSPRERKIAILTNSFVPCNGRFPLLIAMATMFFIPADGFLSSLGGAAFLAAVVTGSVAMTLLVSAILSRTVLRGMPSSFVLELPPYRRPAVGTILVRSLLDRTVFVLGRAAAVAAPAGLLIWILSNTEIGGMSVFAHLCACFDPVGRFFGMDGVILIAFLLSFPANETVIPIIMMGYLGNGTLIPHESLSSLRELLVANGWTPITALCVICFSLFHVPCSTTCLTVWRESGSLRCMIAAMLLPLAAGLLLCAVIHGVGLLV